MTTEVILTGTAPVIESARKRRPGPGPAARRKAKPVMHVSEPLRTARREDLLRAGQVAGGAGCRRRKGRQQ